MREKTKKVSLIALKELAKAALALLNWLALGLELFGAAGMPYYLITVAVSYLISGREGLYKQQKLLCEKTSASFSRKGA